MNTHLGKHKQIYRLSVSSFLTLLFSWTGFHGLVIFSWIDFQSISFQRQWMSWVSLNYDKRQTRFKKPVCTISHCSAQWSLFSSLKVNYTVVQICTINLNYTIGKELDRHFYISKTFLWVALLSLMLHSDIHPDRPKVKKQPKSTN